MFTFSTYQKNNSVASPEQVQKDKDEEVLRMAMINKRNKESVAQIKRMHSMRSFAR